MNQRSTFVTSAALALLLMSCARYTSQPIDVAASAGRFEQRRLDAPEVRAFLERNTTNTFATWPPALWNFEQLALAALYLHPSLETVRAEWAVARAAEITAGGRPNPTLSAGPEYNFNPARALSPWIANVQFDLPIETAGKRRLRMEQAAQLSAASRLKIHSAVWVVRRNVRVALLELATAREGQQVSETQLAARERLAASIEVKFNAGALSSAEVEAERALIAEVRRDIAVARAQTAEARARLASAVGVTLAAMPAPENIDPTMPIETSLGSTAARHHALTARADILMAISEYAATEKSLELEIARQYPDVHLNPGYQWDQGENKWALGISVELPVLNQNQGPIAEAKAKRGAAAAHVHALQSTIIGELDRALTAFQHAQATLEAARAAAAAQDKRIAAARTALENGAAEIAEVRLAEVQRGASEMHLVEARARLRQAVADIEEAVQFPLPDVENNFCLK